MTYDDKLLNAWTAVASRQKLTSVVLIIEGKCEPKRAAWLVNFGQSCMTST